MSSSDVDYLDANDVPLILDTLVAELLKFKPLTPRQSIISYASKMNLQGKTKRPERKLIYFVGGPASGKGTLAKMLCEHFGDTIATVGAGDLLRDEVKKGTTQGKMIGELLVQGSIVPAHITIGLLKKTIEELPLSVNWVLIDGFPRAMDQSHAFEVQLGVGLPEFMLCFHCPDKLMFSRMVKRGATSGRSDDNEATAHKRIANHHRLSVPTIEYYRTQGILYDVDASNDAPITWPMVLPLFINPAELPAMVYVLGEGATAPCKALAKERGYGYLNASDLLKAEATRNDNEPSLMVARCLESGEKVSSTIMINLLRRAMHQQPKGTSKVMIEGFPFTIGDVIDTEKLFKTAEAAVLVPVAGETLTKSQQAIIAYYDAHGILKKAETPSALGGLL